MLCGDATQSDYILSAEAIQYQDDFGCSSASTDTGEPSGSECEDDPEINCEIDIAPGSTAEFVAEKSWPSALRPSCTDASQDGPLDESTFPTLAPFLAASQDYARHSGCRFLSYSFASLSEEMCERSQFCVGDGEPLAKAKHRVAAVIGEFAARFRAGEPALLEELAHAFHTVIAEGTKRAMIASLKALDMWPPTCLVLDSDEEVSGSEASESLTTCARQLYWEELERYFFATDEQHKRHARTASYIVDFATWIGVPMPLPPAEHLDMLKVFNAQVAQFESQQAGLSHDRQCEQRLDGTLQDSCYKFPTCALDATVRNQTDSLAAFFGIAWHSFAIGWHDEFVSHQQAERLQTVDDFLRSTSPDEMESIEVHKLQLIEDFLAM